MNKQQLSSSLSLDPDARYKEEARAVICAGASFDPPYVMMNMLATIIASYGLLADSTSGVSGAIIVAMLLGPVLGVALALVNS